MKTMTKMRRIQMMKRSVQKTNPNAALMKRAEAMAPKTKINQFPIDRGSYGLLISFLRE